MNNGIPVKILLIVAILIGFMLTTGFVYLQHPKFGPQIDSDKYQEKAVSAIYREGAFQNMEPTEVLVGDNSTLSIIMAGLFNRPENLRPGFPLPTEKTDFKSLDRQQDTVIWLGHSSYFVQMAGRRILVDPVFGRYAAPVPFANEAFAGTRIYSAEDMPDIDYLLITHDHWDHLDYPTIQALRDKVRHVICGLGVDQYFTQWGYATETVHAGDWFTEIAMDADLTVHTVPARHYSGRLLSKNRTLWVGFVLETADRRILFGGDSGYGEHIGKIGERFGSFDLAVLDMGQYDDRWRYIHMTPEEAARSTEELNARALLPAHVGKFTIARHAWDEPFDRVIEASQGKGYRVSTPRIGEPVRLADEAQIFTRWWSSGPDSK